MASGSGVTVRPLPGSDLVFAGLARYELTHSDQIHTVVIERVASGEYQWFYEVAGPVSPELHDDPGEALRAAMRMVASWSVAAA